RARRPARAGGTTRAGRRSLSQSPACAQQIIGSQFISPQCRSNRLNGSRGQIPTCRQRGLIRMIEVRGLSKRYGEKIAVNDLSCDVGPCKESGLLGPNGEGKPTTMRLILGLDYPNAGSVT